MLARFRRHARSGVVHIDRKPAAVPDQVQVNRSSFRHGRKRVQNQVGQDLSEMYRVDSGVRTHVVRLNENRDIPFLRLRFEQLNAALNNRQELLLLQDGLWRFLKGQQVAQQSIQTIDFADDQIKIAGADLVAPQFLFEQLHRKADAVERVANLMCHARGHPANRAESIRAPQRSFKVSSSVGDAVYRTTNASQFAPADGKIEGEISFQSSESALDFRDPLSQPDYRCQRPDDTHQGC